MGPVFEADCQKAWEVSEGPQAASPFSQSGRRHFFDTQRQAFRLSFLYIPPQKGYNEYTVFRPPPAAQAPDGPWLGRNTIS